MLTQDEQKRRSAGVAARDVVPAIALPATSLHSIAYLLVRTLAAVLVVEKLGAGLLRKAPFNHGCW